MKFTKMHGLGNDYVYVNCFDEIVANPAELARAVSDRHFGVGSDGLILIMPSRKADFRMRMFNADGSEAEMCGNGIRCVAKFVYDNALTEKTRLTIETGAGIRTISLRLANGEAQGATVDMGRPDLTRESIPVAGSGPAPRDEPLSVGGRTLAITCVGMGNPHCVTFVDDVEHFPVREIGPLVEHHELFPRRTNVEFVQVASRSELIQRTWERGAGETMACGTGASAVLVASVLTGRAERAVLIHLAGGDLELAWPDDDATVSMTGPAVTVFEGEWPEK